MIQGHEQTQIHADTETVWAVQVGREGRWHIATGEYTDRSEAVERLTWLRSLASRSVEYRLVSKTTTVTLSIEAA
ncbi:hypothetical protein ACIQ7D_17500 [Streptomyces sp. NPDC096310]|uniref:hypothetical protein n=1 Tax=Streptomyces sp. NPDC096310 TaxID=3366082 RepID=UPI00382A0A74